MFIIDIIGGLGNQMFCYAFAQSIKHNYNTPIALHTGGFEDIKDNRGFELTRIFDISDPIIDSYRKIRHLTDESRSFSARLRRKFLGTRQTHFSERMHRFDPMVMNLKTRKETYLQGLWQDEDYFKDIADTIRERFRFIPILDKNNEQIIEQMSQSNSVSLHVRRGDYVSNPQYLNILGEVCNYDYYIKALKQLESIEPELHLFIFSDDIEWVKDNFKFLEGRDVTYINHNTGLDSYKDMQLMSNCKHNIIANSTFSWWGAWLNENAEKKVYAPNNWFNDPQLANNHVVPDSWIKINNTPQ